MPTLQQFATDVAATAALTTGSLYYDSTGLVKVVLPSTNPLIPFTNTNLVYSENPALVNIWDSAAKLLHFNSTGTAANGTLWGSWALSPSLLTSLNFDRTNSWCIAARLKSSGSNLRCLFAFDPAVLDWNETSGMYEEISVPDGGPPYVYIRSSGQPHTLEALGYPHVLVPNQTVDDYISSTDGVFVLWSYNHSSSQVKLEFFSVTGVNVYTSTLNHVFVNTLSPIAFYSDMDSFDFLTGLYFSQSYQPFSVWSQHF
jgi:hypothetical protein